MSNEKLSQNLRHSLTSFCFHTLNSMSLPTGRIKRLTMPRPAPRVLIIFLLVQLISIRLLHNQLGVADLHGTTEIAVVQTKRKEPSKNPSANPHFVTTSSFERNVSIFNSWNQDRYVCGNAIGPSSSVPFVIGGADCPEEMAFSRVFRNDPTISNENVPSIVVHFLDRKNKNRPYDVECDVPCAVWPAGNPTMRDPAKIDDTPFQFLAYTMEGSGIYKSLEIDSKAHKKFRYYATTSFQSEVPLSYYSPTKYNIQLPPVDFDTSIKGASFLARNCNSVSRREALVQELMKQASSFPNFRIDSMSVCMRNAKPPQGVDLNNKTEVMKSYLFHFSFENQRTPDYITEKLWGALESGTLPVYFGAPNIKEHVPRDSIIFVDDFSSTKDLVSYLVQLSNNKTLYNSYHTWRQLPLPPFFRDKYDFTEVHSYCRVCRFSFAMKYGYGWDHRRQQIQSVKLPRGETCIDERGWMASPIKEKWTLNNHKVASSITLGSSQNCGLNSKTTIPIPGTTWTRTIWDHDMVTDIELTNDSKTQEDGASLFWQLHLSFNNTFVIRVDHPKQSIYDIFWMQDNCSRVVVVFNETVEMMSLKEESRDKLQVRIQTPLRVRFIVEDIDKFHENGTEMQSYFSTYMIDEFLNPLDFL
jgi:hypothetical protein